MHPSRRSSDLCGQKSATTKEKVEAAFARLDSLGLGEDKVVDEEDEADVQESMRRADLFTSVTPASPKSTVY